MKSIKKNYVFNVIYQILLLIVPLVTAPYISRTLDASSIGQNSYSYAIVSYFLLFANFGFGLYGQRLIAQDGEDRLKRSADFWGIILARLLLTIVSEAILLALVFSNVFSDYSQLIGFYSISVLACAFDISFLYAGMEDFPLISVVGIFVKLASVVLIFCFVKNNDDLLIYVLISSLSSFFHFFILCFFARKYISFIPLKLVNPWKHFWPAFRLFIPSLAISVYVMLDKALIGVLVPGTVEKQVNGITKTFANSDLENGYYNEADTIIKMCLSVITALSGVMLPRNAYLFENKKFDEVRDNIYLAIRFTLLISLPMMFGILGVSGIFVPVFFGSGYDKTSPLLMILSPILVIVGLSGVLGTQLLIPTKRDRQYTISVCVGAVINFALDMILIRWFWSYGAAIGTVVAESCVTLTQFLFLRKEIHFLVVIQKTWKYLISAIFMFVLVYCLGKYVFVQPSVLALLILIFTGAVFYFSSVFLLKDDFLCSETVKVFNKIKSRFKRKRPNDGNQ